MGFSIYSNLANDGQAQHQQNAGFPRDSEPAKTCDEFRRNRDLWQQQVICDAALRPSTKVVAMRLSHYHSRKLGYAFPALKLLASDLSMSKQGVLNALEQLGELGYLQIEQGGGGRKANRYRFVLKDEPADERSTPVDSFEDERSTPVDLSRQERGQHQRKERSTLVDPIPMSTPLREDISTRPQFDFGEDAVAKEENRPPKHPTRRKPKKPDEPDSNFEAFWSAYPKPVAKPAALKAWQAAVKRASPEDILAGVQRYAEERDGEDPQFTKHPATYLANDCWLDPPKQPHARRRNGGDAVMAAMQAAHAAGRRDLNVLPECELAKKAFGGRANG